MQLQSYAATWSHTEAIPQHPLQHVDRALQVMSCLSCISFMYGSPRMQCAGYKIMSQGQSSGDRA